MQEKDFEGRYSSEGWRHHGLQMCGDAEVSAARGPRKPLPMLAIPDELAFALNPVSLKHYKP